MDTEYTKGFKAGLAWEQERIIKLLEENSFADWIEIQLDNLIALIKGETNE